MKCRRNVIFSPPRPAGRIDRSEQTCATRRTVIHTFIIIIIILYYMRSYTYKYIVLAVARERIDKL